MGDAEGDQGHLGLFAQCVYYRFRGLYVGGGDLCEFFVPGGRGATDVEVTCWCVRLLMIICRRPSTASFSTIKPIPLGGSSRARVMRFDLSCHIWDGFGGGESGERFKTGRVWEGGQWGGSEIAFIAWEVDVGTRMQWVGGAVP